jgi:hypothetical protein
MRQLKFRLDSDDLLVRMKLTAEEYEWNDKQVTIGFDSEDLGEPHVEFTWWIVSDEPIGPGDRQYDHVGKAGWLSPDGQRYENDELVKRVEICDEWLVKLFGKVPESLWFKRTR